MASSNEQSQAPNAFIRHARKVYHPLGFTKGYNFVLWFIFGGGLTGFILARIQNLSLTGRFCPEEFPLDGSATGVASACYWISQFPRYKIAIGLHLATSLPGGLLAVFQFVPAIRHRWILYHRLAGYTAILLMVVGNVGAMMLSDTAMGGDFITQTMVGAIAVGTTITFGLAIYNIRHLQLDQHRAWMLRTWFYLGFIVPLRLIQAMAAAIVTRWPSAARHALMTCSQLLYIYSNNATHLYTEFPICQPANSELLEAASGWVPVKGALGSDKAHTSAALEVTFAAGGALALLLNAVGVEVYLWATRDEAMRLRRVSAEMQGRRGKGPSRLAKAYAENTGYTNGAARGDQEGIEIRMMDGPKAGPVVATV